MSNQHSELCLACWEIQKATPQVDQLVADGKACLKCRAYKCIDPLKSCSVCKRAACEECIDKAFDDAFNARENGRWSVPDSTDDWLKGFTTTDYCREEKCGDCIHEKDYCWYCEKYGNLILCCGLDARGECKTCAAEHRYNREYESEY